MKKGWLKAAKVNASIILIAALIAGCMNKNEPTTSNPPMTSATPSASSQSPDAGKPYYEMYDEVTDSSDLPDWTGKQLKLEVWYAHGTGDAKRLSPEQDVVSAEAKRVTGVEIDKDASFDNGGNEGIVKMGMLNAANDWPDVAFMSNLGNFKDLLVAGKVYDLGEALQKYAPNLAKRMPIDKFPKIQENITNSNMDGKTYAFPMQMGNPDVSLKLLDPAYVSPNAQNGQDASSYIFVRDDIIKKLYPEAKTQAEIEDLFLKNGKFTEQEIYDIPVKTAEDFHKMLYDMQALIKAEGLKVNGKPVEVTYAFGGQDNWNTLAGLFGNVNRLPGNNNYFTYYDKEAKSIQMMFQQDFYKEGVKKFNQLVRDKVMDPNSLLENNATHIENVNNGQYAVTYGWDIPDEKVLQAAGQTFRYRKLWLNSPVQTDKFILPAGLDGNNQNVVIFKDSVSEEDLPQVIRYLDYMISEVGEKMYTWGPRSAGLFEEADGKRKFKDKDLEDAMVYNKDNGKSLAYNLSNTRVGSTNSYGMGWPYYPTYMWGGSTVTPAHVYEKERNAGDAFAFFDPGNLPGKAMVDIQTQLKADPAIWVYFGPVPAADQFWKGRDALEKALTKTLAAKDEAQFEELWKSFQNLAISNGATPELLTSINEYFQTQNAGMLK